MIMPKKYTSLNYDRLIHETSEGEISEGAVLLAFGKVEQWIPKSLIDPEFLPLNEDGGEAAVEFWFCEKEELEDFEA